MYKGGPHINVDLRVQIVILVTGVILYAHAILIRGGSVDGWGGYIVTVAIVTATMGMPMRVVKGDSHAVKGREWPLKYGLIKLIFEIILSIIKPDDSK